MDVMKGRTLAGRLNHGLATGSMTCLQIVLGTTSRLIVVLICYLHLMRPALRITGWSQRLLTQASRSMTTTKEYPTPLSGPFTAKQYNRPADHTPNTAQEEVHKYILTLHTDPEHHTRVTALRTQYFPPHLNKLSAHVALFRALPGSQLSAIESDILAVTTVQQPFPIVTGKPFLMVHGVGIHVHVPPAKEIYRELKEKWEGWLSRQDKSFNPHYTVQNKVERDVAVRTLKEVEKLGDMKGMVDGLTLWRYNAGYWKRERDFMFGV